MKLHFTGSEVAERFSLELSESLEGVIRHLMITDQSDPNCGFVSAALEKYAWSHTMWTRDCGTLLREFVAWGRMEEAKMLCEALIRQVEKGGNGYYTFPEKFVMDEKASGSELDGTAAILIGMCMLFRALEDGDSTKKAISTFLLDEAAPVGYIAFCLEEQPLLAGSGEFGGGCGIEGLYVNAVQNNLVALCLYACAPVYETLERPELAQLCRDTAGKLEAGILAHLVDGDEKFIWCVEPDSLLPDPAVLNYIINKGAGLINGILCMASDVHGLDLNENTFYAYKNGEKQFDHLYSYPNRRELFEQYGIWTQFDDFRAGCTGPSYGQGYALQCMLLLNRMAMADKALTYLTNETYSPIPEFSIDRESPYYFYERSYCPYSVEMNEPLDVGCGELNVVCVAEPLKIGRMLAGIDISGATPLLYPRLPDSITGYTAEKVPLLCDGQMYTADITCTKTADGLHITIRIREGILPRLMLKNGRQTVSLNSVTEASIVL